MPGTVEGGKKAAATTKKRHGKDFYSRIGKLSGTKIGGFASKKIGKDGLTGRQRARIVGRAGGLISKRMKGRLI